MPNLRSWTIAGWTRSALVLVFVAMDVAFKLLAMPQVLETNAALGWLGTVGTAQLLGGAVAAHARIGNPLLSHMLFGVYLGVILWAGLWLRMPRLRALLAGSGGVV